MAQGGDGGLRIGVTLGSIGIDAAWWLDSARRLEDAGYDGLWCWDHFVGRGDRSVPVLEQWTTLAAAAAVTTPPSAFIRKPPMPAAVPRHADHPRQTRRTKQESEHCVLPLEDARSERPTL